MSIGLGKRYWVRIVLHHSGDLESCVKFMQENASKTNTQWFELRPLVKVKQGKPTICEEYMCDLVEEAR